MGRSVGRQLAEKGANVIIVARNLEALSEANTHISVRIFDTPLPASVVVNPRLSKEQSTELKSFTTSLPT